MIKIMIVDDDPDIRYTVRDDLDDVEHKEYFVLEADGGEDCIKLLEKGETPDIILLDIMMPKMSGWEVYDKIKNNKIWSKIPIIFLTARTDDFAKNAGVKLGFDYIEKPFDSVNLKYRINKAIEKTNKKGIFGKLKL